MDSHWMNQALQIALFRRILSLQSKRRPLKDFHLGETILPLKEKSDRQNVLSSISKTQVTHDAQSVAALFLSLEDIMENKWEIWGTGVSINYWGKWKPWKRCSIWGAPSQPCWKPVLLLTNSGQSAYSPEQRRAVCASLSPLRGEKRPLNVRCSGSC